MRIDETPCPDCGAVGNLHIDIRLVAKPPGTFSLAGNQMKVSASQLPVLECPCGFSLVGEFDGPHVVFRPPNL
jgi:hypothetical protein